jgi:hypothetical protein
MSDRLRLFPSPAALERLDRPFFVYYRTARRAPHARGPSLQRIELRRGTLIVDGVRIRDPRFGRDSVSWNGHAGGGFSAGRLRYSHSGRTLRGMMTRGETAATAIVYEVFLGTLPPTNYSTTITIARQPAGTDPSTVPAGGWTAGLQLQLGYQQTSGQPLPTAIVNLDSQPVTDHVALETTTDDLLQILFTGASASTVLCTFDPSLYLTANIVFSTFGDRFAGTVSATCADTSGSGAYLWSGQASDADALACTALSGELLPMPEDDDDPLSLTELLSLVPDDTVATAAYSMLVENMKWAIAQSPDESAWLTDFFVEAPPALTQPRIDLINQDLTWYQQEFAKAYLSWALNNLTGPGAPTVPLTAGQSARVEHYLRTGIALEPSYVRQMNGVYTAALLSVQPRLQDYLDAGGPAWAATLLSAITTPDQLSGAVNRVFDLSEIDPVNNLTTLLQLLDPSGASATTYAETILTRILIDTVARTSVTDPTFAASWLTVALQSFAEAFGGDEDPDVAAAAAAVQAAAQQLGGYGAVAAELAASMAAGGESLIAQAEAGAAAFAAAHADLAATSNVVLLVTWAGGLANVSSAFSGAVITPEQQAKMIATAVKLAVKAVKAGISLLQSKLTLDDWNAFTDWFSGGDALAGSQDVLTQAGGSQWARSGTTSIAELFDAENGAVDAEGTLWTSICRSATAVVSAIGLAAAAVSAVLATIQFVNDLESGQPVSKDAMDGILAATSAAGVVCTVLDLTMSLAVFGLAASVLAGVGVIVFIVSLFMPAPATPDPVDQFMSGVAVPFADSLPAAPAQFK